MTVDATIIPVPSPPPPQPLNRVGDAVAKRTAGAHPGEVAALPDRGSRLKLGWVVKPLHADLLLAFARLGDVVGGLHPHERVHLYAEGLLNTQRHVARKVSLPVEQTRQCGPG